MTFFSSVLYAGCSAGFLNVPRIKGSHYAMKSGMLAAESILEEIWSDKPQSTAGIEPKSYPDKYAYISIRLTLTSHALILFHRPF